MATDDWKVVDVNNDLNMRNRELYLAAKAAYRQYKAAKDAFEEAMQESFAEHLPPGLELKFGYNYGKLSIAVGEAKKAKAKAQSASLVDFLGAQANGGHAS